MGRNVNAAAFTTRRRLNPRNHNQQSHGANFAPCFFIIKRGGIAAPKDILVNWLDVIPRVIANHDKAPMTQPTLQ